MCSGLTMWRQQSAYYSMNLDFRLKSKSKFIE